MKHLKLEVVISNNDNTTMDETSLDDFMDGFIDYVESKNMYCGGGIDLIDGNIKMDSSSIKTYKIHRG